MRSQDLSPLAKALYSLLATYADDGSRSCWPNQRTLSDQLGVSVDTVKRTLRALEQVNVLERVPRHADDGRQISNDYVLTDELAAANQTVPPGTGARGAPGTGARGGGCTDTPPLEEQAYQEHDHKNSPPNTPQPNDSVQGSLPLLSVVADNTPAERKPDPIAAEFEGFWKVWPRKVARPAALKAYRAARKRAPMEAIAAGLRAQLPDLQARDVDKRPHATTWLNQDRWQDDPAHAAGARSANPDLDALIRSQQGLPPAPITDPAIALAMQYLEGSR